MKGSGQTQAPRTVELDGTKLKSYESIKLQKIWPFCWLKIFMFTSKELNYKISHCASEHVKNPS